MKHFHFIKLIALNTRASLIHSRSLVKAGVLECAIIYPSPPVSGRAWNPKGLFLRQLFRSSAMRVLAMPLMAALCAAAGDSSICPAQAQTSVAQQAA